MFILMVSTEGDMESVFVSCFFNKNALLADHIQFLFDSACYFIIMCNIHLYACTVVCNLYMRNSVCISIHIIYVYVHMHTRARVHTPDTQHTYVYTYN